MSVSSVRFGSKTTMEQKKRGRGRKTTAGAVLATSAVLLAACGSSASASVTTVASTAAAPVSISLWESHNGGPVGAAMTALVDKFNSSHKGVQVNIVVTKASKKLEAAIAAGNPPALAEISHYDGTLVKAGALISWNTFLKSSQVVTKSNMIPVVWKNGEVNGQHYRFLADMKISEVFYNETLFKQAGINSVPTTWSQLATDTAKLKSIGVIPLGWKDSSAHILPAFMSNGGSMLKGSNSVGNAVDFNTPAGQETFSFFHSLYASSEMQFHHGTTLRQDLAAGKIAMIDGTSAGYQKVLDAVGGKFSVGAFVEPGGSTGRIYNMAQGLGFVLPKGTPKAKQEAAWTFVQWWFEPSQQAYWAENTGFAPETKAGIAAIPASFLTSHPGLAASLSAAESPYTFARPVSDSYREVQAALDAEFFNAVTGTESVSAALAKLQSEGNSYMSGASKI
ncbi:MAG: extracellular solute-binding protein [Acidimicrobiaceae bacterium]|nr:extracellular solute-binding protein [Acidimicrobiaceae bacterium]